MRLKLASLVCMLNKIFLSVGEASVFRLTVVVGVSCLVGDSCPRAIIKGEVCYSFQSKNYLRLVGMYQITQLTM